MLVKAKEACKNATTQYIGRCPSRGKAIVEQGFEASEKGYPNIVEEVMLRKLLIERKCQSAQCISQENGCVCSAP
jgi:hypothetical protein